MSQEVTRHFPNGESLTGVIVGEALVVEVMRVGSYFYIVNKLNTVDPDEGGEV